MAALQQVHVVTALPKTNSGKILRATMRKIADGEAYRMPATIEDVSLLDAVKKILAWREFSRRCVGAAGVARSLDRSLA